MSVDLLNLHGCEVKDERGAVMARLYEDEDGKIRVIRTPSCSVGMYFFILDYLRALGVDAK